MRLKDISFSTPAENIYFDDVLLQMADKHSAGEFLRFWESPVYFIVLGRIGKQQEDVDMARARRDAVALLRRSSGGGTVLQGPGCLNFSLVLSKEKNPVLNDLRASYAWISGKVIEALAPMGVRAKFFPISDIALAENEMKFSGNAQRRGKTHLLHHGTILYDFDLDKVSQYLKMPKDTPDYRKGRLHKDFMTNIKIKPADFKSALIKAMGISRDPQPLSPQELFFLKNYIK